MNRKYSTNDINLVHRVLKADIKRVPNSHEDEIILGVAVSGVKNVLKLPGVVTTSVDILVVISTTQLITKYVQV